MVSIDLPPLQFQSGQTLKSVRVTSHDAAQIPKRGFKMRWMTWFVLHVKPLANGSYAFTIPGGRPLGKTERTYVPIHESPGEVAELEVGPGRFCSPPHRMPFNSTNEG